MGTCKDFLGMELPLVSQPTENCKDTFTIFAFVGAARNSTKTCAMDEREHCRKSVLEEVVQTFQNVTRAAVAALPPFCMFSCDSDARNASRSWCVMCSGFSSLFLASGDLLSSVLFTPSIFLVRFAKALRKAQQRFALVDDPTVFLRFMYLVAGRTCMNLWGNFSCVTDQLANSSLFLSEFIGFGTGSR